MGWHEKKIQLAHSEAQSSAGSFWANEIEVVNTTAGVCISLIGRDMLSIRFSPQDAIALGEMLQQFGESWKDDYPGRKFP